MNTFESHLIILVKQMLLNIPPENNGGMCIPNPQSMREVHMVQGGIMKEEGMKQLVFH